MAVSFLCLGFLVYDKFCIKRIWLEIGKPKTRGNALQKSYFKIYFAKFTGKYLCQNFFINKIAGWRQI